MGTGCVNTGSIPHFLYFVKEWSNAMVMCIDTGTFDKRGYDADMLRTSYSHVRTRGTLILEVALVAGLLGLLVSIEHMHLALQAQQSNLALSAAASPTPNPTTEDDTATPKETAIKKECPKGTVQNVGVVEKDKAAGVEVKQTLSAKKSDCVVRWCDLGGACYLISAQEGAATALACGGLNNPCAEQKIADVKDETGITFGSGVAKGIGATSFGKEYSGILTDAFGNTPSDAGFDSATAVAGPNSDARLKELAQFVEQKPGVIESGGVALTPTERASVSKSLAYLGDDGNMQRLSDDMVGSNAPVQPQEGGVWGKSPSGSAGTFRSSEIDSMGALKKYNEDLATTFPERERELQRALNDLADAERVGASPDEMARLQADVDEKEKAYNAANRARKDTEIAKTEEAALKYGSCPSAFALGCQLRTKVLNPTLSFLGLGTIGVTPTADGSLFGTGSTPQDSVPQESATVAAKTEAKPSEVIGGQGNGWTPERNTPTVGEQDERLQPDAITKANSAVASAESKLRDVLRGDYTDAQEQEAVKGNWDALNRRVTDLEAALPGTTANTKKQIESAIQEAKKERDEFATTYGGKEQLDAEVAEAKEKAAEAARRELADEARRLGQRTTQQPPANQPPANQPPARGGDDFLSRLLGGGNGMSGEEKALLARACDSGNRQACTALQQANQSPLGQLMQGLQKALGGGGQGGGSSANNAAAQACAQYPGTTLTNGTCACPSGQQWDGKTCGTNQACAQYPGTTLVNGTCACPSGQQWNGSACAAGSTTVTAELACAPSVQEKGQPVQVSWSCSEGATSRADGFSTNGQVSGTAQVVASSTPGVDPNNRVMRLGLVCVKEGVTQSKTCDVTVSSTFISMASTPSAAVDKGSSVRLAWITGGMKSGADACTLTSSTEETFTHQGNSGVLTTHPLEEDTTFTLTCTTLTDAEKTAQLEVKIK
jgi:hypothetical protein